MGKDGAGTDSERLDYLESLKPAGWECWLLDRAERSLSFCHGTKESGEAIFVARTLREAIDKAREEKEGQEPTTEASASGSE